MTTAFTESDLLRACRTLFGPDIPSARSFLFYVQPSGAKSAYRKKAKETHPDTAAGIDPSLQRQQSVLFVEIFRAYETLNAFFEEREKGLWPENRFRAEAHSGAKRPARPERDRGDRNCKTGRYNGPVPRRRLEIGQYLYYRGLISYKALIASLTWQRCQRPVIGDIAVRWGWIGSNGIRHILQARDLRGRFGERAVDLGLLSLFQVRTILFYQRSRQERLGRYFVSQGILAEREVEQAASELQKHNSRAPEHRFGHGFHT